MTQSQDTAAPVPNQTPPAAIPPLTPEQRNEAVKAFLLNNATQAYNAFAQALLQCPIGQDNHSKIFLLIDASFCLFKELVTSLPLPAFHVPTVQEEKAAAPAEPEKKKAKKSKRKKK